jgi:hypothetical protein
VSLSHRGGRVDGADVIAGCLESAEIGLHSLSLYSNGIGALLEKSSDSPVTEKQSVHTIAQSPHAYK